MMRLPSSKQLLSGFLIVLALASIASLQALEDMASSDLHKAQKVAVNDRIEPLIPSTPILKVISLGDQPLAADILWINSIQYFGSQNTRQDYPSLGGYLTAITNLDPKYGAPYEFGLVVLPFMHQTPAAIALGEKAQIELPGRGLNTYYLASDYLLNVKDYKKAAYYFTKAAKEPGSPQAAAILAGTALDHIADSNLDRQAAIEFWKTAVANAKNEEERAKDQVWVDQMVQIYDLELKTQAYKNVFGTYPASFDQLINAHFLTEMPVSPAGRQLAINPANGRIDFDAVLSQQ